MATHGRIQAMRAAVAALVVWAAGVSGLAGMGVAHAEVAAADPIDVAMRQCLARRDRSSPAGQIQCMGEAQQQWQAVMDGAYQRLLKDAPATRSAAGKTASAAGSRGARMKCIC
ncbi:hypothetical protein CSX04_03636 [Burkholderia cepacia]|nr:hypothetical protein CSX04_03636 [Burkholderia cepacia]